MAGALASPIAPRGPTAGHDLPPRGQCGALVSDRQQTSSCVSAHPAWPGAALARRGRVLWQNQQGVVLWLQVARPAPHRRAYLEYQLDARELGLPRAAFVAEPERRRGRAPGRLGLSGARVRDLLGQGGSPVADYS